MDWMSKGPAFKPNTCSVHPAKQTHPFYAGSNVAGFSYYHCIILPIFDPFRVKEGAIDRSWSMIKTVEIVPLIESLKHKMNARGR
jgi:hypothetical protein